MRRRSGEITVQMAALTACWRVPMVARSPAESPDELRFDMREAILVLAPALPPERSALLEQRANAALDACLP